MSYYLIFIILFVFCVTVAYLIDKSVVRMAAPANFFMAFLVYIGGLGLRMDIGMYTFFACVLIGIGFTVYFSIKRKDAVRLLRIVLDPGAIAYFVSGIALGIIFTKMVSFKWDEMTHWALVTKNMVAYDNFGNVGNSTTMFNRYVPASGMFMYAFQFFNSGFINGHLYSAFDLLLFSMLLPITELFKNKLSLPAILSGIFFLTVPAVMKFKVYSDLSVDVLLGVGLAYMYMNYVIDKGRTDWFTLTVFALSAFYITLIKSTGLVMVIFGLLFPMMDALTRNTKKIVPFLKKKVNVILSVAVVLMIVFAKVSWSVYVNANNCRAGWNASEMTIPNIIQYITEPNEFQSTVTKSFLGKFFIGAYWYDGFSCLQIPQWTVFVAIIVFATIMGIKMKNKAFAISDAVLAVGMVVGYAIATLLLYIFSFCYTESLRVASFSRYMSTMNVAVILILTTQMLDVFLRPIDNAGVQNMYGIKGMAAFSTAVVTAGVLLSVFLNNYIANDVIPVKSPYNSYTEWAAITEKLDKNDTVYYVMHDFKEEKSQRYILEYLKLRFVATPVNCSGYDEGGSYKDGRESLTSYTGNPFQITFTQEEFEKETENYKYLWIDKTSKEFNSRYGSLFEGEPQAKVLYERTVADGKTLFVKASVQND